MAIGWQPHLFKVHRHSSHAELNYTVTLQED
jgi:hypothetical protein